MSDGIQVREPVQEKIRELGSQLNGLFETPEDYPRSVGTIPHMLAQLELYAERLTRERFEAHQRTGGTPSEYEPGAIESMQIEEYTTKMLAESSGRVNRNRGRGY